MIKFKEQDGLIFKMLDEPVPLTKDAEVPCLVRFIMPFSERFKGKHDGVAFFCDAIKKNPLYGNRLYAYETRRVGCIAEPRELEIIGYPVADGSIKKIIESLEAENAKLEKLNSAALERLSYHACPSVPSRNNYGQPCNDSDDCVTCWREYLGGKDE